MAIHSSTYVHHYLLIPVVIDEKRKVLIFDPTITQIVTNHEKTYFLGTFDELMKLSEQPERRGCYGPTFDFYGMYFRCLDLVDAVDYSFEGVNIKEAVEWFFIFNKVPYKEVKDLFSKCLDKGQVERQIMNYAHHEGAKEVSWAYREKGVERNLVILHDYVHALSEGKMLDCPLGYDRGNVNVYLCPEEGEDNARPSVNIHLRNDIAGYKRDAIIGNLKEVFGSSNIALPPGEEKSWVIKVMGVLENRMKELERREPEAFDLIKQRLR